MAPIEPGVHEITDRVKRHLADLVRVSANMADAIEGVRHVMREYCATGRDRGTAKCTQFPGSFEGIEGEWFVPQNGQRTARNLYLHGGAWVAGSVDTHRHLIDEIAAVTKAATFAPNYRLAPDHPYPLGLEDCARALEIVRRYGPEGASPVKHVTVIGDSAGGNLAAAVAIDAIQTGRSLPDALVMISPVTDFRPPAAAPRGTDAGIASDAGRTAIRNAYLGQASPDDPLISPLAASDAILERFPPTLIQVASDENLRDQSVAFAAALWNNHVPVHLSVWPNMPHVFQLFVELEPTHRALDEIAAFLRGQQA